MCDDHREVGGRAGAAHVLEQRRGRGRRCRRGHVSGARAWWPVEGDAAAREWREVEEEGVGAGERRRRWVVAVV